MTSGQRIKIARDRAKLTQEQFALRLGVTKGAVSQWESDKTEPRNKMFKQIAMVTGVPLSWLVGSGMDSFHETHVSVFSDKSELLSDRLIPVYGQDKEISVDASDSNREALFMIPCPQQLIFVHEVYAALISGSAMLPRYGDNEIVIIDPLRQAQQGDYVAARIRNAAGKAKIIIGQLVKHDKVGLVLKQLNPNVLLHFPHHDIVSIGFIAMSSLIR